MNVIKDCHENIFEKQWFSNSEEIMTAKQYFLSCPSDKPDKKGSHIPSVKFSYFKNWESSNEKNIVKVLQGSFKYKPRIVPYIFKEIYDIYKRLKREIELSNKNISKKIREKKEVPWLLSNSQINIIDVYEAEITGEIENDYLIEFSDAQMDLVEAKLSKTEFEEHPGNVTTGTSFGIVLYKQQGDPATKIGAWPIEKYWNKSLSS